MSRDWVVASVLVSLDGEGGFDVFADFSQWETHRANTPEKSVKIVKESQLTAPTQGATDTVGKKTSSKRLSYMEQRDWDSMEENIKLAEAKLLAAAEKLNGPEIATSPGKLRDASADVEKAQKEVDRLYARWTELETKLE